MDGGGISYFERMPEPPFRRAIKALWSLEGHLSGEAAALPKPYVELIVSLGDAHLWRAPSRTERFQDGWLTPIQAGPRFSTALGATCFVGARLEPDAATMIFGPLPLGVGEPPIPAEDVPGADFRRLRDALAAAPDQRERVARLERWVAGRLDRSPRRARTLPLSIAAEPWRVDALCDALNIGDRAARRRFEQDIGCSPKYWLRLHRLSAVLACPVFQRAGESLAATAARFGLADQAHLAREFRLLAGMPPSAYQARRQDAGLSTAPTMAPARPRRFFQAGPLSAT